MSEDKRICPFMNILNPRYTVGDQHIYCCEEKCMAWGKIQLLRGSNANAFMGCKLIERDVEI